jgi:hypothetical protein
VFRLVRGAKLQTFTAIGIHQILRGIEQKNASTYELNKSVEQSKDAIAHRALCAIARQGSALFFESSLLE